MQGNVVGLMARMPQLGQVKTRLATSVGDEAALKIYRSLLGTTITNCRPANSDGYQLGAIVTPSGQTDKFETEYSGLAFYVDQIGADLGDRMTQGFELMFTKKQACRALLIGADIPRLSREHINAAFAALDTNEVVWGPTTDGGYYLIGLNMTRPALFEKIRWGRATVLENSIAVARSLNLSFALLDELADVDTREDLDSFPDLLTTTK